MVVCRCVFREQDSPGSGGGCGCVVCPSPVSVDCPGILDDWGTGEWTCSVHVYIESKLGAKKYHSNVF